MSRTASSVGAAPVSQARESVRVEGLRRSFGSREVVCGIDVTLERGDRLAICGPNGSGKSTVLRCVAGTVTPTQGRIVILGHAAGSRDARRLVGVSLSQERSFYLRLSGRENLLFAAGVRGLSRRRAVDRVAQLEEELALTAILAQRVDRCSTGMVQQLAFARALIGRPAVLVLDEPTRSLDHNAYERFWRAIEARPDVTVLIATHRDDDIERCHGRLDLDGGTSTRD